MKNRILSVIFPALVISLMMSSCTKKDEPIIYKDPGLVWENPADITEGTALSYYWQLNARADADWTYVYTPPVGAQLGVGNDQELKVDFYPDGYYKRASKTVKINVLPSLKPTNGLTTAVFNSSKTYGKMTDQDGNEYKTVVIGTQTWMAENLRTTKYRDGSAIPNVTDFNTWYALTTGAYCTYNNTTKLDSIATLGRIYNGYTITDKRNIAPKGWHVPTDEEWKTLIAYLGSNSVAAQKLKETGTTHWLNPNTGATNESGFSAIPTGSLCLFYTFGGLGYCAIYWSSTQGCNSTEWWNSTGSMLNLGNNNEIGRYYVFCYLDCYSKLYGCSVRLVKD